MATRPTHGMVPSESDASCHAASQTSSAAAAMPDHTRVSSARASTTAAAASVSQPPTAETATIGEAARIVPSTTSAAPTAAGGRSAGEVGIHVVTQPRPRRSSAIAPIARTPPTPSSTTPSAAGTRSASYAGSASCSAIATAGASANQPSHTAARGRSRGGHDDRQACDDDERQQLGRADVGHRQRDERRGDGRPGEHGAQRGRGAQPGGCGVDHRHGGDRHAEPRRTDDGEPGGDDHQQRAGGEGQRRERLQRGGHEAALGRPGEADDRRAADLVGDDGDDQPGGERERDAGEEPAGERSVGRIDREPEGDERQHVAGEPQRARRRPAPHLGGCERRDHHECEGDAGEHADRHRGRPCHDGGGGEPRTGEQTERRPRAPRRRQRPGARGERQHGERRDQHPLRRNDIRPVRRDHEHRGDRGRDHPGVPPQHPEVVGLVATHEVADDGDLERGERGQDEQRRDENRERSVRGGEAERDDRGDRRDAGREVEGGGAAGQSPRVQPAYAGPQGERDHRAEGPPRVEARGQRGEDDAGGGEPRGGRLRRRDRRARGARRSPRGR